MCHWGKTTVWRHLTINLPKHIVTFKSTEWGTKSNLCSNTEFSHLQDNTFSKSYLKIIFMFNIMTELNLKMKKHFIMTVKLPEELKDNMLGTVL